MDRIRHPDGGQFAGTQQPCQRDGIPAIGLDAIAGAGGHERGGDHVAGMAESTDLPIQSVSGRTGLIAEVPSLVFALQLAHEALDGGWRGIDLAEIAHLAIPTALGERDSVLGLCSVDADIHHAIVVHGPSSFA
jgi:hypothetical protein